MSGVLDGASKTPHAVYMYTAQPAYMCDFSGAIYVVFEKTCEKCLGIYRRHISEVREKL